MMKTRREPVKATSTVFDSLEAQVQRAKPKDRGKQIKIVATVQNIFMSRPATILNSEIRTIEKLREIKPQIISPFGETNR